YDAIKTLGVFVCFCLAASATYVINDYMDMEQDRIHPLKRNRPLASGAVSPKMGLALITVMLSLMFLNSLFFKLPLFTIGVLVIYIVLHCLYSWKLKNLVIIDVLIISTGFLLRVLAGTSALSVGVSSWLVLCTFSVAIFLALGKRRHEVMFLNGEAVNHRPVLENYSVGFLDQLLQVVTTSTFIFYCLYSVKTGPGTDIQSEKMMLTIPFVTYGIFRYLYLIYHKEDGGSPTALLFTDLPLLICVTLWLAVCVYVIYWSI
ncbi:MAG: decaprenyl-phosphate phosphoribosyltransferase, partial [Desulfomonilaceae bacterium]